MDLGLVTTDVLIEELFNRSDHGILVLFQDRTEDSYSTIQRHKGNNHMCAGLCADIQRKIFYHLDENSQ